ncbi:HEAT repeat domain-containing protein [Paenibacillus nasutitermitis]|uniref:Phytanoyl-CoA dioxygenase n=1 Tax=Paenibacillus nasutitermitis TaxID=1652958 RepID=A0A916YX08_9BACL|nr:HEAT repeat domain-containing protein [Paenibacillus nasutitermitis]GGD65901.1 hypothetical protein GCM10010911_24600 [Paenibacillus nasutitermitis]
MEQKTLQLLDDEQMQSFISKGFLILKTDFKNEFHTRLLEQLDYVYEKEGNPGNNLLPRIRELQVVFDSPVIKGALTSVLGPNYIMHTHRYGHLNSNPVPGGWHKDSYWGYQRMRNHKQWWAMIMYFPQDTPLELGPTGVMPGTQYHESRIFEQDDNDWEGKANGGAGTFALIHYDIWHRSNSNLTGKQRYMLKFEFMRTDAATEPTWNCTDPQWQAPSALDIPMDRHDLLWENNWNWMAGKGGDLSGRQSGGEHADVAEFAKQLQNEDAHVRAEAANQLGLLAGPDAGQIRQLLADALQDSYEPVRLNAAYGLAACGSAGAELLLNAVKDGEKPVAVSAAYGLTASGAYAEEGLIRLTKSDKELTVHLAAFALGELDAVGEAAAQAIIGLTKHASAIIRRTAVEVLGNLQVTDNGAITAALAEALADEDHQVRFWAGLSLAKKGPQAESAIPELVHALDDDSRYVRGHAAEALRRIGTNESNNVLLDYLLATRWCPISTPQNEWYP